MPGSPKKSPEERAFDPYELGRCNGIERHAKELACSVQLLQKRSGS